MKYIILLAILALALTACQQTVEQQQQADVVINLQGANYKFLDMEGNEGPTLTVKQGDVVTINFESIDGFHNWVVDEFNARTDQVRPGTPASVTFTATQKGTFEYYCSVGQHRALGMVGTLIVN